MTVNEAMAKLASAGMVIKNQDGEYRVNFKHGFEATAYYTDDLTDAVGTGLDMARRRDNKTVERRNIESEHTWFNNVVPITSAPGWDGRRS